MLFATELVVDLALAGARFFGIAFTTGTSTELAFEAISLSSTTSPFLPSAIASLKLFTAPPTSPPRLRSFLVPNISTTIINTINQCQILNEPMIILLKY